MKVYIFVECKDIWKQNMSFSLKREEIIAVATSKEKLFEGLQKDYPKVVRVGNTDGYDYIFYGKEGKGPMHGRLCVSELID